MEQAAIQRIYLTVISNCDPTGYVRPLAFFWTDGKLYPIDGVADCQPVSGFSKTGSLLLSQKAILCYTILVRGKERKLYYERGNPAFGSISGRWFVRKEVRDLHV